jgi:hypothetical protein
VAEFVKTGTGAVTGVGIGRLVPPPDPQQWVADQQRVVLLSADLSSPIARGRVAAYIPESVAVRLASGNMVNVPIERVVPLSVVDLQSELDAAVVDLLGGGPIARARYASLLAAGYTVNAPTTTG